MTTQEQLMQLLEVAKQERHTLKAFKNVVVKCQQFELASAVREIENSLFPESEEVKKAKSHAKELQSTFGMVGLNVAIDTCWLLYNTIKEYDRMGGDFSLKESSKLVVDKRRIFDTED